MPVLTITTDDGTEELVRVKLGEIEPATAAITVLKALSETKKPRAPRSDRGTKRKSETRIGHFPPNGAQQQEAQT